MAGISGLLAWGCYEIASVDPQRIITTVTVGLITFIMGGVTVAVNFHDKRIGINIKMLSGIFCVIGLMMDAIFSFFAYKISLFVILNGLLLMLYLLIVQRLYRIES